MPYKLREEKIPYKKDKYQYVLYDGKKVILKLKGNDINFSTTGLQVILDKKKTK